MYAESSNVRTVLALEKDSLLQIDASGSGQPCSRFGLHPNLQALQTLYNDGDLLFASNVGVLQQYVNKDNWRAGTGETALFAHNTQQSEVQKMDIFEAQAGRGVGGRMLDVLSKNGFNANAVSVDSISEALVSSFVDLLVISSDEYEKFDPISSFSSDPNVLFNKVSELNKATNLGSNLFAETYSSILHKGLAENLLLYEALQSTSLDTTFPDSSISDQFQTTAKMMKTKDVRGVDRDIFYVQMNGYDTHTDLTEDFDYLTRELDEGFEAFTAEMKTQGLWDEEVTIVMVSEFARTLTENTGRGSDHAWGGWYLNQVILLLHLLHHDLCTQFYALFSSCQAIFSSLAELLMEAKSSGSTLTIFRPLDRSFWNNAALVRNKSAGSALHSICCTYEANQLSYVAAVIPSTPWDSIWNGVAQWFGITSTADLNEVLPNRNNFLDGLFTTELLYG